MKDKFKHEIVEIKADYKVSVTQMLEKLDGINSALDRTGNDFNKQVKVNLEKTQDELGNKAKAAIEETMQGVRDANKEFKANQKEFNEHWKNTHTEFLSKTTDKIHEWEKLLKDQGMHSQKQITANGERMEFLTEKAEKHITDMQTKMANQFKVDQKEFTEDVKQIMNHFTENSTKQIENVEMKLGPPLANFENKLVALIQKVEGPIKQFFDLITTFDKSIQIFVDTKDKLEGMIDKVEEVKNLTSKAFRLGTPALALSVLGSGGSFFRSFGFG